MFTADDVTSIDFPPLIMKYYFSKRGQLFGKSEQNRRTITTNHHPDVSRDFRTYVCASTLLRLHVLMMRYFHGPNRSYLGLLDMVASDTKTYFRVIFILRGTQCKNGDMGVAPMGRDASDIGHSC